MTTPGAPKRAMNTQKAKSVGIVTITPGPNSSPRSEAVKSCLLTTSLNGGLLRRMITCPMVL